MCLSKKAKIRKYLEQRAQDMGAFDLLLADYLDGSMLQKLKSLGMTRIDIFVDFHKQLKCIGIQGRYGAYFADVQIYPEQFGLAFDLDEADEDVLYPLQSREQVYLALSDALRVLSEKE